MYMYMYVRVLVCKYVRMYMYTLLTMFQELVFAGKERRIFATPGPWWDVQVPDWNRAETSDKWQGQRSQSDLGWSSEQRKLSVE